MRLIENISHPLFRISIHEYNDKYIVSFAGGPMEQLYRFDKETVSLEGIKTALDEPFLEEVKGQHNGMYDLFKKAFNSAKKT